MRYYRIDLTVQLKKKASAEEINQTLYAASESELRASSALGGRR